MSFFKILLNTALVTAVASGVYYYLDQNSRRNAEAAEDPNEAPGPLDRENIKDAADRAYTSIRHGTDEVAQSIRRSVGPQGEEILDDVTEAAGIVRETVTYAGRKVGDIVTDSDSNVQEKAAQVADTVRYAAAELRSQFSGENTDAEYVENLAEESDFADEPEAYDAAADSSVEPQDEEMAAGTGVYRESPEDAADEAFAEESIEAAVETPAEDAPGDAGESDAPAGESTAQPVAGAAEIEEFFDDETN